MAKAVLQHLPWTAIEQAAKHLAKKYPDFKEALDHNEIAGYHIYRLDMPDYECWWRVEFTQYARPVSQIANFGAVLVLNDNGKVIYIRG